MMAEATNSRNIALRCLGWLTHRRTADERRCFLLCLGGNRGVGNVHDIGSAARDVRDDARVLAQPTVPSDFEQVGTFPRVGNQYPSQQVTGVGCNIFGECKGGADDVFVEKIDVVTIWVGRVVVEGKISS